MQIRPATPADVPLVHTLIRELAEYERLADTVVATQADIERGLFGPHPAAEAVLAEIEGEPAGFALFFQTFSTFVGKPGLYLEDLFVRPAVRRRGVGRALLTHLAGLATKRGCGRFEWSVLDWNAPAIAFYRSLGAELLPDWRLCRVTGPALDQLGGATGG